MRGLLIIISIIAIIGFVACDETTTTVASDASTDIVLEMDTEVLSGDIPVTISDAQSPDDATTPTDTAPIEDTETD